MPRGVTVGTCGSAPSPHTIGSRSFWLFSIPRRTGLETSSGDWIPASSENSHAASTIPRDGPTSTGWMPHPRTRTGYHPIAWPVMSSGRDLLRGARLLPRENGRCRSCGSTWVACSSSRCSPSSCVGTIRTCCSFVRRSTSKVGICWYSSLAPHVLTSRKSRETATRLGNDRIRFHVRRNTFVPADDFMCAFEHWDRRRDARFEECWLVPSIELARRTANQRDAGYLTVDAHLDRSRDHWAEFRHPVEDQADVLRRALHDQHAAA